MTIVYILLAIFMFGFMILTHELGHYAFARLFHVKIFEFSIGMGPKVFSRVSRKTQIRYSCRLFPIGGFVSMAGEDDESDEPDALCRKPVWQRMIITAAGGLTNLITGILVMTVLVCCMKNLYGTTVERFGESAISASSGLCVGDTITAVDGAPVHIFSELSYQIMHRGAEPVDLTVQRDGQELVLYDVQFPTYTESGHVLGSYDFVPAAQTRTPFTVLRYAFFESLNTVRIIWESLIDLAVGNYGVQDLSGPVGVTQVITSAAKTSAFQLFYMLVFISMNLGILNLLPFPALDGGRLLFQLIELIFRRPVNRKVEGYIHTVGLLLLLALMVFVTGKDIWNLFRR